MTNVFSPSSVGVWVSRTGTGLPLAFDEFFPLPFVENHGDGLGRVGAAGGQPGLEDHLVPLQDHVVGLQIGKN